MNIKQFCANEDSHYTLTRPWVRGGFRYARNAHVFIRVPTTLKDTKKGSFPDPLFYDWAWSGEDDGFEPWPPVSVVEGWRACGECSGRGFAKTPPCEDCDGDGTTECDECGAERDCPSCDGSGEQITSGEICQACGESGRRGQLWRPLVQQIGTLFIAIECDFKIRQLRNPRFRIKAANKPIQFTFTGGQGFVMPKKAPEADKEKPYRITETFRTNGSL